MNKQRKQYPSQDRLRELFDYDADLGDLVYKDGRSGSSVRVSPKHLSVQNRIHFCGKDYRTHEMVWIFHEGYIPDGMFVNSKAGVLSSRIEDLVLTDARGFISRRGKKNETEFLGVHSQSHGQSMGPVFICQISYGGEPGYKGSFSSKEAAAACYDFWAKKMFGKHAILNGVDCDFEKFRKKKGHPPNRKPPSSGHKGVYKNKKRWMARIKKEVIGTFDTKEQAARAYNRAARDHYGEHAIINDIPDPFGDGDVF